VSAPQTLAHDWFPAPLPGNVRLGAGSWLYSSYAFRHCRSTRPNALRTGRHCGIYLGSSFELGPAGEVEMGDYCTLVGVIVATNARTRIGHYCFLAHDVVIADAAFARPWVESDDPAPSSAEPDDAVVLGDDVWVATGAVLLRGTRLGDGAIVGAGAVVNSVVPPRAIVGGNPACVIGWAKP